MKTTLKREVTSSSEAIVDSDRSARRHDQEDWNRICAFPCWGIYWEFPLLAGHYRDPSLAKFVKVHLSTSLMSSRHHSTEQSLRFILRRHRLI